MNKNKNGLPLEIKYCEKCNISNQNPTSINEYFHTKDSVQTTIKFDENNICSACNFNQLKWNNVIDWKEREKELVELCNEFRKNDGSYDCIVGGSGGKDSVFQSHILKYKYGMHPLTVTWTPHMYTDIGWKNFQSWINEGGFDNFLYSPNGKIHRLLTQTALKNLCHPFQPFILGQKTFVVKMAAKFDINLIFDGEMPGEYGRNVPHTVNRYNSTGNKQLHNQEGFSIDPLASKKFTDVYLGGNQVGEYLEEGVPLIELQSYMPLDPNIINQKNISKYYLGYFIRWVPQECYYYAVEHTNFEANPERTEGTYSKYNSLDDKTDGFFFYTRCAKFGIGRAMMESAQEIRNSHITKEEGLALIEKFDGEYPKRYENEFFDYVGLTKKETLDIIDSFRPEHIWNKKSGEWKLNLSPKQYFNK